MFLLIPAVGVVVTLCCMTAAFFLYRGIPLFRGMSRPAFGVMLLAASFGNVTYLGLPIITGMLGREYGYIAITYDLLATTPVLLTVGVFIAARYGRGKDASIAASFMRVLKLPPLWAVILGIAVRVFGIPVPSLVADAAQLMGRAVIPIMTFTVGLALDFQDVKRLPVAAPALAIKLLLAPVLVWWIGSRIGISGNVLKAVTIEGAMPVMVLSLVIADEFELDVPLVAACIAASTVLLFVTLPMMLRVLF